MSSNDGRTSTRLGFGKTFNLDSLGHDVRRNLVKVDPRLPEDLKNVALLLKEERNILSSLQNIAQERKQASICLYNWGKDNSEDVADITEKMSNIMSKMSDVETVMAEKYEKYRNLLKDIREAEQRLLPAKERRRKINEEMSKTIKTHPRSPRIRELEAELEQVNRENAPTETDVGNLVRRKLKEAYTLLLDATFETSERLAIIAGFGGYIIGQLDANPVPAGSARPKYTGDKVTSQIVKDCQIQLHNWQPPSTDIGPLLPTLTNTAPTLLAAQKEEYEAKLAQVNAEMTSLREAHEKQILEQTAKYDELAQSTSAKIDELTRTTSARIEELTSELENQKQGYKAQLDDMANALSSQREAYEKQVGDLTSKLSEQQKKSEQDLVEIRGVVATEKQKNEVQLREYQTLLAQKHEYEVQLRERDNSINKLQNDMNVVATEKGKLSQLVKDLEETLKSKSSTLSQKEEKINKLEDDITGIKSQLAGLKIASPAPAPASPASGASTSTVQGAAPARSATAASVTSSVSSPPVSESSTNSAALPPPLSPANPHLPPPGGPFQQNMYDPQGQPFYNQQGFQPQQPFYQPQGYYGQPGQPGQPGHPQYAFQGQPGFNQGHPPPPPSPQQQQQQQHPPSFVGGFYLGPPDDAPPAYEPPADGVIPGGDEKKK